jgi:transposase
MATMADTKGRRTRRSFTDDYKTGSVRLVLDEGKTVAIGSSRPGGSDKDKTGLTTAEREELMRRRKDVRELRMERDVLKKPRPSSRRTPIKLAWIQTEKATT